jgi:outer membrane protein insertion porin family
MVISGMCRQKPSSRTHLRRAASALAFATALGWSGGALAQNVVVQGNSRVDAETIRSYFTGTSSEQGRQALIATGLFSSVKVSRSGGNLIVSVSENSTINRVAFEGNSAVKKEVLEPELLTKARTAFNAGTVNADIQRIAEIYRRTGRGLAKVSYRTVDLPNGRMDVVFTIDEGTKTGVKEIRFNGNSAYSDSRLRNLMSTTEMNILSWLKTSDVYDPDRLAADQEQIRRFYLKNGYADFQIVSSEATFDAAQGGYIVAITVSEGRSYTVGAVRVESRLGDISSEELQRHVTTASGQTYNSEAVEKSLQNLTNVVARKGYAFSQVRPSGNRNTQTGTIDITYVVEEGPRVYIERMNVRGNTRTRDYVIRREFDLGEGDAYNKILIDRAERRLNNLGFFKKVRITNEPGSSPDRVIVNVDVEDQPTGSFSIAGGYSTSDGFIGEVSVSESNFLGRGQFVRVAGNLGQRSQGVDFSFTEPYFLGQRMAAGFDLFSRYNDNTRTSRFESRTTGGQIRFGLPITEEFTVGARYSLYQTEIKIPNTSNQPFNDCTVPLAGLTTLNPDGTPRYPDCAFNGEASLAIKEAVGDTLTSLAGLTLSYNTLDNTRDPRSGFYIEAKPDVAGLGGDSKFFRVTGDARYYHEITDDLVGILRAQGGHVSSFSGNLRIVDHFFLGPSLVRGFEASGIGPRDVTSQDGRANAIGGTTYFGGSAEVQFPLPLIPRDFGLRGAVFADAGTLFGYKGSKTFDINRNGVIDGYSPVTGCATVSTVQQECFKVSDSKDIRSSAGMSLLWSSPLGPIRFDYAFVLSKSDGDRTQAFRFSGGTKF